MQLNDFGVLITAFLYDSFSLHQSFIFLISVALEILEDDARPDVVVVCCGGRLLQQCATRIDTVFRPFLVDTAINRKILDSFLRWIEYIATHHCCKHSWKASWSIKFTINFNDNYIAVWCHVSMVHKFFNTKSRYCSVKPRYY